MAIAILHALHDPTCSWASHVQTFPESFNTPLFWEEQHLELLKGSIVYHLVGMMKRRMDSDWESIHAPLSEQYPQLIGSATSQRYLWAMSSIYSRAVEIIRGGKTVRCIPPLVDMGNHNPNECDESIESLSYLPEEDAICMVSSRDRSAGDEIYVVYGRYPNSKLLYSYGFVVDNCPHKAIDLWPRVPPTTVKASEKQQLLLSHPLTAVQTYDFTGTLRDHYISPALLATVRIIAMNEEEMQFCENAFAGELISVRNELAAYNSLLNLIISRMQVDTAEVRSFSSPNI
jgi:hypothetical protein